MSQEISQYRQQNIKIRDSNRSSKTLGVNYKTETARSAICQGAGNDMDVMTQEKESHKR
jgi:hypothetical protein